MSEHPSVPFTTRPTDVVRVDPLQLWMKPLFWVIVLTVGFFWLSALSFFPVPWPDDPAFYLPGMDLVSWPPRYLMHVQAAFVPTYDQANFNTMPALPLLMGLAHRLGLAGVHQARLLGMIAFGLWAIAIMLWAERRALPKAWVVLLTLVALTSPPVRWGAMVVRPEIWQVLFFTLLMMELDGAFQRRSQWRIPGLLALAAYFHFEGIVWVPSVMIGVFPWSEPGALAGKFRLWVSRLWSVAWRTLVLLAPWFIYIGWHWELFKVQMDVQFHRLAEEIGWNASLYATFHDFFVAIGSTLRYPKFYNYGKIVTWLAMILGAMRILYLAARFREDRGLRLAAVAALGSTWYLWLTKEETWFIAMIHGVVWTMMVVAIRTGQEPVRKLRVGTWAAGLILLSLAVDHVAVAAYQWQELRPHYSWTRYRAFVDCVDRALGDKKVIWQPMDPDVLVELAVRRPDRDYTRALDFPNVPGNVAAYMQRVEAVIHSRLVSNDLPEIHEHYAGPIRPVDLELLKGALGNPMLDQTRHEPQPGWDYGICQIGPFWAAVARRSMP